MYALQEVCLQSNVIALCLSQLEEPNSLLKQWLAICLGKLWKNFDSARWCGVRDSAHDKLYSLLWHEQPDVSTQTGVMCNYRETPWEFPYSLSTIILKCKMGQINVRQF